MTNPSAAEVASLVRRELEAIVDPVVRNALELRLAPPELHVRDWDYGGPGERYPCWTVASDPSTDTAIVYSVFGFGPACPWGLVSLSNLWFGMDSGWFTRLEDAFVDSHMGSPLPIWDLVAPDGVVVLRSVSLDEAFAKRDQIDAGLDKPVHHVLYRSRLPGGVP